jgi:hypothetical protein
VYLSSDDPQQVAIIAADLQSKVQACQQAPDECEAKDSAVAAADQSGPAETNSPPI